MGCLPLRSDETRTLATPLRTRPLAFVTAPGRRHALAMLLALGGCSSDPTADYLFGIGDPVRGAALYAPRNLGNTSRWNGRPADAAVAVEQLEFLTYELATNPRYAPEISPSVLQQLQMARAEMRGFLGIADTAAPSLVIEAMRRTAVALRGGSRAAAEAALSSPAFTAGPVVTLSRLGAMPRLPRTAEAAGAVAAEFDRLDRRR